MHILTNIAIGEVKGIYEPAISKGELIFPPDKPVMEMKKAARNKKVTGRTLVLISSVLLAREPKAPYIKEYRKYSSKKNNIVYNIISRGISNMD